MPLLNNDLKIELTSKADGMEALKQEKKKLDRDRVAYLMSALERLMDISHSRVPMVSRLLKVAKLAALLEIMELFGYEFEDSAAAGNALSELWEFNAMRGIDE